MARRQITEVVGQQRRMREIARVRFGDRKEPNRPGRPILLPRVSSQDRSVVEMVAAIYGGEVQEWKPDEKGPMQWDVKITDERGLAIAVPPGIAPYSSAYEQWAGKINTVRCDGVNCQFRRRGKWVEHACVCAERGLDESERPCKMTTRLTFAIVGIERFGLARVDTGSYFASTEVPATMEFIQMAGRAAWLRMEMRTRSVMVWDAKEDADKPQTRRFPVIVVDAPFMVDEIMLLERAPNMASLPAPARPALGAGRPQLPPGPDPRGPVPEDIPPLPPPVAPVIDDDPRPVEPAPRAEEPPTPPPAPEPEPEEPPLDGEVMNDPPDPPDDPAAAHSAWAESWGAPGEDA